ncbi:class I SAM-dependent methyltransferase [Dermatophilaceae bacterium Soc4.6]
MTTVVPVLTIPSIDPAAWPDLLTPPSPLKRRVHARIAAQLFTRIAARFPIRVELPDGSTFGGAGHDATAPTMQLLHPQRFYGRVGAGGLIGFGESYMAGDWESPDLGGFLAVLAEEMGSLVPVPLQRLRAFYVAHQPHAEKNSEANTRSNISRHYDLSNDLFETFLDSTMTYSSALFDSPRYAVRPEGTEHAVVADRPEVMPVWSDLAAAQQRKIDRLLDLAGVREGSRVLEIGTGWGELCMRAAARGATVRSVTLSSEQQALATTRVTEAGYADRVQIDLLDYRAVDGEYDAIVSVEMIEAVGHEYWQTYFETIDRLLAPGGKVAIQAITMPHDRMLATTTTYTWIHKYIFPGGFLPSTTAIVDLTRDHTTLRVTDRLTLGQHYAHSLRLWDEKFQEHAERVAGLGFDDVFRRMWHFYLEYSRGGFLSGYLDVQQILLERPTSSDDPTA